MQVGVEEKRAGPGVQHQGKAELRSQPPGVSGKGVQGVGHGTKQQIEQAAAVCEDHRPQRCGQGEDHVEVSGVEQTFLPLLDPVILRRPLAGRAVAVQARVEQRDIPAAVIAVVAVPAQGRGAASLDIAQNPSRFVGEGMRVPIARGKTPEDLRDLKRRTRVRVRGHQRRWI